MPAKEPERLLKLLGDLDEVRDAARQLAVRRRTFHEVADLMMSTPRATSPGYFYQWMWGVYVDSVTVAIRRMTDRGRGARSFVRFLHELGEVSSSLSRAWHVELWGQGMEAEGHEFFDQIAGAGARSLPRRVATQDAEAITAAAKAVADFASTRVAHKFELSLASSSVTFGQVNRAIDAIGELVQKYGMLLTATSRELLPHRLYDWREPFRVAWAPR